MSPASRVQAVIAGRAFGCGTATPSLTWFVEGSEKVAEWRVQTSTDEAFVSLLSDTAAPATGPWVPWPGRPLTSRERVHWRMQVRSSSRWSEWCPGVVEAGLLERTDWQAVPIGPADDPGIDAEAPSPLLRTTFRLAGPPRSARLYVTALGLVEASVNGRLVTDDVFAPGWSSYATRLAYDTYDVTALLQPGDNELAGLLGDGWYRGGLGWGKSRHRRHYRDRVALLAQLEVTLEDGARLVVATGPDGWTSSTEAVRSADIYDGCRIDLTAPAVDGQVVVVEPDLASRLFVREGPPVRRTEVRPSVASWGDPVVHDFGQNLSGWVRL